jgi:hypothetical protein
MLSRAVLDALLPGGSLWSPQDDGDLDRLLDGIAANADSIREHLLTLSRLRDPMLTTILDDLEREFGVIPDPVLSETVRRVRLHAVKTGVNSDGGADFLQGHLQAAGFNMHVHVNNPPVNPESLLNYGSAAIMGNNSALFGRDDAVFGGVSQISMLVNGKIYDNQVRIAYTIPPAAYWHLIFFVGGHATRNGSGELVTVAEASVDIKRKNELESLIVSCKPLFTWCGPIVRYVTA